MRATAILRSKPPSYWPRPDARRHVRRSCKPGETDLELRKWDRKAERWRFRPACIKGYVCRICGLPFDFTDEHGRGPKIRSWYKFTENAVDLCTDPHGDKLACFDCMWELTGRRRHLGAKHAANAVAAYAYLREYAKMRKKPA